MQELLLSVRFLTFALASVKPIAALVAMVAFGWTSMPVRTASACSAPYDIDPRTESASVVLARVIAVGQMETSGPLMLLTPVRIQVIRTLLGAEQDGAVETYAAIRDPRTPGNLPCFPLDRDAILGAEAVIALRASEDGSMQFGGREYWALDEPSSASKRPLASLYYATYPEAPAVGGGLSEMGDRNPSALLVGSLLTLAGGTIWLTTFGRRVR